MKKIMQDYVKFATCWLLCYTVIVLLQRIRDKFNFFLEGIETNEHII